MQSTFTWRSPKVQWTVIAIIAVVALLIVLNPFGASDSPPSPEELFDQAMTGMDAVERERAAVALASHKDEPLELIRRLFGESEDDRVRAAAAGGLARLRDLESLSVLIDAMESESQWLRGKAGSAVQKLAGLDAGFRSNSSQPQRDHAVRIYRQFAADLAKGDSKLAEFTKDPDKAIESAKQAPGPLQRN